MATGFEILFENLANVGFFTFFLPLILFMAVYYGLLKKTEAIGEDDQVVAAASLALSFATVFGIYVFVPHTFFPQFFGLLSMVLVVLLGIALALGMVGIDLNDRENDRMRLVLAGLAVLVVVLAMPMLFNTFFNTGDVSIEIGQNAYNFILTLAMILVMGGVVYGLTQADNS